ncbi:MAG: pyridoxamine 5'-phosphate oxidase family protein [Bacteroidota bacterium]
MTNDSLDLLALARQELLRSNADRKHPFRFFQLATFGPYPELRTVVKRKASSDFLITFFTDSRSPKVGEIVEDNRVSALFYHPRKQLQLRLKGVAQLVERESEAFTQYLHQVKQSRSVKDYLTLQAPGSPVDDATAEAGFGEQINLAVIEIQPQLLDILQLGRAQHFRSADHWEAGAWRAQPLVP